MLVERELGILAIVFPEIPREPMWENPVDAGDVLPHPAMEKFRPAGPGLIADDHREPVIGGTGPQRGFAKARPTESGDTLAGSVAASE